MEGILHVPPDRGTIIGRAIWKPRYVVVAAATAADARYRVQKQRQQSNASSTPSLPSLPSLPSIPQNQTTSSASSSTTIPRLATLASPYSLSAEVMYLSVFKNKGDAEPIQQHAIGSITDCQVQMLAHRKQGPILPTLVINVSPDPVTDKLRKRRSSRTAGLTTTKDTAPTTLWFRPADDNPHKQVLLEWCHLIQGLMLQLGTVMSAASGPLSPITPASPTFVNPFSKDRAPPPLPQSQSQSPAQAQAQAQAYSQAQSYVQSQTYAQAHAYPPPPPPPQPHGQTADSPSLRSRRSDLSHTSSNLPPHVAASGYSTTSSNSHYNVPFFQSSRPADLPSPATTVNEFQSDFAAPPSAISSSSRGRDSVSSPILPSAATAGTTPTGTGSTSPPVPRETILDRAFQMRFIPGAPRDAIPGEEKLSSLARFDALMREAEERKRLRQAVAVADTKDQRAADARPCEVKRSITAAPYVAHVARPSRSNSYNHQPPFQPQFQSQFPSTSKPMEAPTSGWDLDEDDSGDESVSDEDDDDEDDDDDDEGVHSGDDMAGPMHGQRAPVGVFPKPGVDIAPNRLRALDFIAGRHEPALEAAPVTPKSRGSGGGGSGSALAFDPQTLKTLDSGPSRSPMPDALRPQTGYASRNRPSAGQRTHSQPQLAALDVSNYITTMSRRSVKPAKSPIATAYSPSSAAAATTFVSSATLPRAATSAAVASSSSAATLDVASPVDAVKRLSFNDLAKRLTGSTSSLLLVQSNASNASNASNGSDAVAPPEPYTASAVHGRRASGSRMTLPPPPTAVERCGWRSSVNVISTEGGFM